MQKNELSLSQKLEVVWRQVVRNKAGAPLVDQTIVMQGDLNRMVDEFAEYCVESSGDRYTSVGVAMNEINAQSRELLAEVSAAKTQEEVERTGLLLEAAVALYKSLETYYVRNFDLRTGTTGD
jgi:hypothetical protein